MLSSVSSVFQYPIVQLIHRPQYVDYAWAQQHKLSFIKADLTIATAKCKSSNNKDQGIIPQGYQAAT